MAKNEECIWNMGTECSSEVNDIKMFDGLIVVRACDRHLLQHKKVMLLSANGIDVETIVNEHGMDEEWLDSEIERLGLNIEDAKV